MGVEPCVEACRGGFSGRQAGVQVMSKEAGMGKEGGVERLCWIHVLPVRNSATGGRCDGCLCQLWARLSQNNVVCLGRLSFC